MHGPAGQLCRKSMEPGRLGPFSVSVTFMRACVSCNGNLGGLSFIKGDFHHADILFNEAVGLGIMWDGGSVLKTIFISEGALLPGVEELPIVSENYKGSSFKGK